MGALTEYLQDSFAEFCPRGWTCRREVPVLDGALAELFGCMPKADVTLQRDDGQRKLWIEFEVSRADPVANHAKFATAHLFQPLRPTEAFISMVSGHVVRGRRNLAANTICLMRHFVFDRKTKQFAPSKFCAYLPLSLDGPCVLPISAPAMTIELYASLDETEARFDGNRAWRHLNEHLAMKLIPVTEDPELSAFFEAWSRGVTESIQVDGRGVLILCPPKWFA
jgi:hypothetical protein